MPIGTVVGFESVRNTTTAATLVRAGGCYVTARLAAGAGAVTLDIYDHTAATTDTAKRVATLKCAAANGVDELGVPIRCKSGVAVKASAGTGEYYIFIR